VGTGDIQMHAIDSPDLIIADSTWLILVDLLRVSATGCLVKANGMTRGFIEQELEDWVQAFLLKKLRRPAWIAFIHQCSRSLSRRHLPCRIRADFRSFVIQQLKRLEKTNSRFTSTDPVQIDANNAAIRPELGDEEIHQCRRNAIELLIDLRSLDRLPKDREMISLRLQGWKLKKIAERVGVSERTVRNRLKKLNRNEVY
jgi:DNA-directed RNA polymerase specialized sigma24 family protein